MPMRAISGLDLAMVIVPLLADYVIADRVIDDGTMECGVSLEQLDESALGVAVTS